MKAQIDRKKILIILNWCVNKFDKSKYYNSLPKIRSYQSNGSSDKDWPNGFYGYHNNKTNTIAIFLGCHTSVMEICHTIIHEYKHYLLNSNKYDILYKKLKNKGKSEETINIIHPHERRCRYAENKWGNVCFNKLRNQLYKK